MQCVVTLFAFRTPSSWRKILRRHSSTHIACLRKNHRHKCLKHRPCDGSVCSATLFVRSLQDVFAHASSHRALKQRQIMHGQDLNARFASTLFALTVLPSSHFQKCSRGGSPRASYACAERKCGKARTRKVNLPCSNDICAHFLRSGGVAITPFFHFAIMIISLAAPPFKDDAQRAHAQTLILAAPCLRLCLENVAAVAVSKCSQMFSEPAAFTP